MLLDTAKRRNWMQRRIVTEELNKYCPDDQDFIPEKKIEALLQNRIKPEPDQVRAILQKSLAIENLTPAETALLMRVEDPDLLEEMRETALKVKLKVYDNRIVTFAPLYMGNYCVNNCGYCGFRAENTDQKRKVLNREEIRKEVEVLAGKIGHRRLTIVYGEHPKNDVDYILQSMQDIYEVKVPLAGGGIGNIRRVNVNAPPLPIDDLRAIHDVGIGTYQVFQETYHRETYARMHPQNTIKGNYRWRLYCMHRALEAGIDDVGIGALFGLYDWRFEVLGLVYHSWELERQLGIGPHTISFPRLEPALNTSLDLFEQYRVNDEIFKRIVLILRLAVPFTGMIITARESAQMRRESISLGVTQTDANSNIELGGYSAAHGVQQEQAQQFMLGDTRSLDEVVREFAEMGNITSFCTAGYRCGRTGECIMKLLRSGTEGQFCKLNAVLTFKEWLDDFASEETRQACNRVLRQELDQIKRRLPRIWPRFQKNYTRICEGERDIYM